MNEKNGSAPKSRDYNRLGSLREQPLAAGLTAASGEQQQDDSATKEKRQKQSKSELKLPDVEESLSPKKRKKSKKQQKQSEKARRRNQAKQRKNSLLRGIERQKERKKTKKVGVSAIFDDTTNPVAAEVIEHRFSIRKVQEKLREVAKSVQAQSGYDESLEFANDDKECIRARLSAFEEILPLISFDENADIELVMGFDFGSTSSKIVCRFPYDEGLGAFAVPNIDGLQADHHPYYWKTLLWEDKAKTFELTPRTGAHLYDHLKLAFLRSGGDDRNTVTAEMVHVTAYLALMIRQSLGWLWQRVGRAIGRNTIGFSVNFGFPTETGGMSPQLDRFKTCTRIATRMALSHGAINRNRLTRAFDRESDKSALITRTMVVPEFIGAVMGYFHSAQRKNGQFMICDIGGLTIDAVCFGFYQASDGGSLIRIYGSSVAPFGAEIAKIAVSEGVPKTKLRTAIGSFFCDPIIESHKKTGHNAPAWGGTMPLFVIGGGRHYEGYFGAFPEAERLIKTALFRTSFGRLELDLNEELDIPKAKGRSCGRLMVAWGLSHSDLDLPEWLARSSIPDGPKLLKVDVDDIFVGKEQT